MSFRNKLKSVLVKTLSVSNKDVLLLLNNKRVLVNGEIGKSDMFIFPEDEIQLDNKIIRPRKELIYLAYNKPRGIESTFNKKIKNSLHHHIQLPEGVFYLGRLDKDSEGLMIFTNNGKLHDKILREENNKEKEYLVHVDKIITSDFLEIMGNGVNILGRTTKAAKMIPLSEKSFYITLTQGINRQIRRMCYKCGYEILMLKRIAIAGIQLSNLPLNTIRSLTSDEIKLLTK